MAQTTETRAAPPLAGLAIDRDDELPVGVQLLWRLRALIGAGALAPGDQLPSVRDLAELAGVNVNTARAAYRRLEDEGLIVSRQGSGTYVGPGAASPDELRRLADGALAEAAATGIEPRELAAAIYAAQEAPAPSERRPRVPEAEPAEPRPDEDDRRAARRELRRQIARLEAELAAYAGTRAAHSSEPRRLGNVPRVVGISELERTRDRLLERVRDARAESERKERRRSRARRKVEEMVREPEEHKWRWVSSEETGDPGCKEWRVVPRFGPVGAAMGWWRVKVSGGCPLAGPLAAATGNRAWRAEAKPTGSGPADGQNRRR